MTTKTAATFKLGRLARSHDKRIPMLHTLMAGKALEPVVPAVDYTKGMPAQPGVTEKRHPGRLHVCRLLSRNPGMEF